MPPASSDELSALAPDDADAALADAEELLVVQVGERTYALPAAQVREVARAAPVTPLPGPASWIRGLAAVRGALLPVGDLRRRASHGVASEDALTGRDAWMAVVDDGRRGAALVGLRVRGVALAQRTADDAAVLATLDAAGLPVRGDARLMGDDRRAAGAGLVRLARGSRARGPASRAPAAGAASEPATQSALVARLDVTALLDDLYDDGG
ncbi:chemotaxis protein CheW [Roseisolibacter agri]|uniref:CheW-like domain-containing protein n=1 Tax=Roseisolibacter agri TaxID=2014610 RepID=A0AA37QGN7_9BACT|nr:chemotaxis protein CheW [Roseisolibacter agri]GLC26463.1 hypothetical protein rosag_29760 [Roseisolibacter agri]